MITEAVNEVLDMIDRAFDSPTDAVGTAGTVSSVILSGTSVIASAGGEQGTGLWIGLVSVVTAVGAVVVNLITTRQKHQRESRAEAIVQLEKITDRLQAQLDHQTAELSKCHDAHATANAELARMAQQIIRLQERGK